MRGRSYFRHWGPERIFHKGDFKYLILNLLKEKPRYGYEIMRELENKFHGFYSPSPGTIYPTLQYLEELDYVTSQEQNGKRIYKITEDGLKFLEIEAKTVQDIWERMKQRFGEWGSEFHSQFGEMMSELKEIGRMLVRKARSLNREKFSRITDVLKKAYTDIEKIVSE